MGQSRKKKCVHYSYSPRSQFPVLQFQMTCGKCSIVATDTFVRLRHRHRLVAMLPSHSCTPQVPREAVWIYDMAHMAEQWKRHGAGQGHGAKYKDVDGHGASMKKKIYLHLMSSMCMGNRHKKQRGVLTLIVAFIHMQCGFKTKYCSEVSHHSQLLVPCLCVHSSQFLIQLLC